LVVLPFTYIEVATPIPERATSTSYSFLPVAFVIGALAAGDHFRQLAETVVEAVLEVAAIGIHADIGSDLQRTIAIDTVAAETLPGQFPYVRIELLGVSCKGCRQQQYSQQ